MISLETQFKNHLIANSSFNFNPDGISRCGGSQSIAHLRFRPRSRLEVREGDPLRHLKEILTKDGIDYKIAEDGAYSGTPDYKDHGLDVTWNGKLIPILVAIHKPGRIKRKSLAPARLGLNGFETSSASDFKAKVLSSIKGNQFYDVLVSMLNNIEKETPIVNLDSIIKEDVSRITSDFGEILSAYKSVLNGNHISFPAHSNNNIADFYENGKPISVKNDKGGGKLNLTSYKDLIDVSTLPGKFLKAMAEHNRDDVIQYGLALDSRLKDIVPSGSTEGLKQFVLENDYDSFLDNIKQNPDLRGLGIPRMYDRSKALWNEGSLEPIHFTLLTLINRIWGESNKGIKQISDVVNDIFIYKSKFSKVEVDGLNIKITEVKFNKIKQWKLEYHSRCYAAWHNWPAIQPVKGIKND
jgi:hypothetical protein